MSHPTPETEPTAGAFRGMAPDDLITLRRFFGQTLLEDAGVCATSEDLRTALGHVMWLSALTNRLLASAVHSYDQGGTLPAGVKLTLSRRAVALLDDPGHRVPGDEDGTLTALLLQALLTNRAANRAVSDVHHASLGLK